MRKTATTLFVLFSLFLTNKQLHAQFQNDTIITSEYFGFDYWNVSKSFWAEVYTQMANDNFPFDLVGTDAINWQKIEPNPPVHGVHTYEWGFVDTLIWYTNMAGKKLDIGIRPLSNWGTLLKADSVPIADWALVMSPIKPDSLCFGDTASWGMTARQAWKEFIYNFVERYDGDTIGQPPVPITSNVIKTLTIGNEVEAPGHFFASESLDPFGTVAAYKEIQHLTYDTAKFANPDLIVVRGKSNPGHIFDDLPTNNIVYNRREEFFDSIIVDLSYGPADYDMYTFNYNDHYTELLGYSNWIKQILDSLGYSKPFTVGDARTTLFPRDNFDTLNKIMPSIYTFDDTLLVDENNANYVALKLQWRKDKVQQSIKKLTIAGATNQFQISLQPVYVITDFEQGNPRTFMWMYSGFFDPYIYDSTGSLAQAREPLYWSVNTFADAVIGANKQALDLNLDNNIYAYKYIKQTGVNPIIIWHENHFLIDANTGLLQRNQDTIIDMSSNFTTQYVRIKHFTKEVDASGMPITINDTIVAVNSVPINEFPVILFSSTTSNIKEKINKNSNIKIFPNPTDNYIQIQTTQKSDIYIYDTQGKLIKRFSSNRENKTTKIDFSGFPQGVYLISIKSDNNITTQKVIKY